MDALMAATYEVRRAGCPVFAEDLGAICRQHRRNGEGLYVMDCPFCRAANGMSVSDRGSEGTVSCAVCGVQFRIRWEPGEQ